MLQIEESNLLEDALKNKTSHHNADMKGVRAVFLNGQEIRRVHYANEEHGVVIVLKTDLEDKAVIADDCFVYEIRFGKVEVKPI